MDEQIFQEYLRGASLNAYEYFGAHCTFEYEKYGVSFSVYAPNAVAVELIGRSEERRVGKECRL